MSKRADLECGCRFQKVGGKWWHVVACPDHRMFAKPRPEVPVLSEMVSR